LHVILRRHDEGSVLIVSGQRILRGLRGREEILQRRIILSNFSGSASEGRRLRMTVIFASQLRYIAKHTRVTGRVEGTSRADRGRMSIRRS
jgi:hypothetical protein